MLAWGGRILACALSGASLLAAPFRVLHFGDSHLSAPVASGAYREALRQRFGTGGPGFGLPWARPLPGLRASASGGWIRTPRREAGLSGAALETRVAGAWLRAEGVFRMARLHLLRRPGGGRARITLDGQPLRDMDLSGDASDLALVEVSAATSGPHRLELHALGGAVRVLGAAFEAEGGAQHSVVAFNGAEVGWLAALPEALLRAEVAAEKPDAVILAFGTNEGLGGSFQPEAYRRGLARVLTNLRQAAPSATLVLVGPPDGRARRGGALDTVVATQRDLAQKLGAHFVDQRQAMGGAGAIDRWRGEGLAAADRVHLTAPGYQRLSRVVLSDLLPRLGPVDATALVPVLPPSRPVLIFRRPDGTLLITDDPAQGVGLAPAKLGESHAP